MKTLQPDRPGANDVDFVPDPAKIGLRKEMLVRRAALTAAEAALASQAAAARVLDLPAYRAAREVAAYLPVKNEIDAGIVARQALTDGKRLLLPRCRDDAPGLLDFGCVSCLTDVEPGRFGILEPRQAVCRPPEAFAPDLILVPGLAFDHQGRRLGFGGGYYDRLLAMPLAGRAFSVGLGFDFQLIDKLPADPWDKPVNAVVTERQTLLMPS